MSAEEAVEGAAEKTKSALGKKIGPLPAGVWVALVVGGLGIAWWTRSRSSSEPAAEIVPQSTVAGAGNLGSTVTPDTDTSSGSVRGTLVPGNNETWASMGLARLVSLGMSGVAADQAIRKYLGGDQLDSTETSLIDKLLSTLGPPPVSPPLPLSGSVGTSSPIGGATTTPTKDAEMPTPVAAPSFLDALYTPAVGSTSGSSITTNYSSPTSSIYNVNVGGQSVSIPENLVWSGAFNGVGAVAGYTAQETAAIRDALHAKGLA